MKKLFSKSLLLIVLLAFAITGCEDLGDITFDATYELPDNLFEIDETADDPQPVYESSNSTLELDQHPDVAKYKSKVKKLVINNIHYEIVGFSAPDPVTLTSAQAIFSSTVPGSAGKVAQVANIALSEGVSGNLQTEPGVLEEIADIFLNEGQVSVYCTATLSDSPVTFRVKVTLDTTVTVNPI